MPAYFDPDQTWAAYGGWVTDFYPGPADHEVHAGLPAGRITDDSEQAFSLARAYLDAGAITVDATVRALIDWYDRTGGDQSPYVGPSTRRGAAVPARSGPVRRAASAWLAVLMLPSDKGCGRGWTR